MKCLTFKSILLFGCFFIAAYFNLTYANAAPNGCALEDSFTTDLGVPMFVNVAINDCPTNSIIPGPIVSSKNPDAIISLAIDGTLSYFPGQIFFGDDEFYYTSCDSTQTCDSVYVQVNVVTCINLNIHVFLEGAYNPTTKEMETSLNLKTGSSAHRGLLPGQTPLSTVSIPTPPGQPYNVPPINYQGTPAENSFSGPYDEEVVDWVYLSFRSETGTHNSPTTILAERAGLLYKDGHIELVGNCLTSNEINQENCYIVIEHRNHMAVMSHGYVKLVGNLLEYDFRVQDSYFLSGWGFGQKRLSQGPDIWVMYVGDIDQLSDSFVSEIHGGDKILWNQQNGFFNHYTNADLNFDGQVNGTDKALWSINNGYSNKVYKYY